MASGGTDYYDRKTHEWHDTVMVIYEYEPVSGPVRAFYQALTTNSNRGNFEAFLGDKGTLVVSEAGGQTAVYRERLAPEWGKWVKLGYLAQRGEKKDTRPGGALDVSETVEPSRYRLPVTFDEPRHKPHLENFVNAIRGKGRLNCPAEIGFETAVSVFKVHDAVESSRKLDFTPEEFIA